MTSQVITPKFQLGDCVKLSSGTQNMTITWLYEQHVRSLKVKEFTGFVECSWFDGLQLQQKKFHQDALIKCEQASEDKEQQQAILHKTVTLHK